MLTSLGVMEPGPVLKHSKLLCLPGSAAICQRQGHSILMIFGFWISKKSPLQAWYIVVFTKLVKILWQLPTLTRCSMPSNGDTVLGPCSIARALYSDGFSAFDQQFFFRSKRQFLQNSTLGLRYVPLKMLSQNPWHLRHFSFSFDGYSVWQAIARPAEVQLTWVLFLQLENSQLMILGTGSASKVHSKPDL